MAHIASEMVPLTGVTCDQNIILRHRRSGAKGRPIPLNRVALNNITHLKHSQARQETLEKLYPPSRRAESAIAAYDNMDSSPNSSKRQSEDPTKYPPQAPSARIACALDNQMGTNGTAPTSDGKVTTSTPTKIDRASLDKELPPEPEPTTPSSSPEQHDNHGVADLDPEEVTFAVLTPKSSLASITDSVHTDESSSTHEAKTIRFKPVKGPQGLNDMLQLGPDKSRSRAAKVGRPVGERVVTVTVQKNGSPLPRKPTRKASRHDLRGFNALSQSGQSRVVDTEMARQAIANSGILEDSAPLIQIDDDARPSTTSPLQEDDGIRRSSKYDCGPTVRYSIDAHDVIMGGSASGGSAAPVHKGAMREKANSIKSVNSSTNIRKSDNEKASGKQAFRNIVVELKSPETNINNVRASRAVSGHSTSDPNAKDIDSKVKEQPAFLSRLSRPTAASAAREAVSKASIKQAKRSTPKDNSRQSIRHPSSSPGSEPKILRPAQAALSGSNNVTPTEKTGKGFKSRFSSFLPGRRRSEQAPSMNSSNDADSSGRSIAQIMGRSSTQTSVHRKPKATSRSQSVREPTDRMDRERDRASHDAAQSWSQRAPLGTRVVNRFNANAAPRPNPGRGNDGEPPSPPRGTGGPGAHYDEVEAVAAALESRDIDTILRDAENHLDVIIRIAEQANHEPFRSQIIQLVETLGNAIQVARQLHIINISQAEANAGVATAVSRLGVELSGMLGGPI